MALNVRPDYIRAEEKYRAARTPDEKLAALREMLATAPKHKSAEKLLKDIKQRISRLRREQSEHRKKSGQVDPFHILHQGAGQVLLLGTPNVGKSRLVGTLTKAHVKIGDYPFTTQVPAPGMALHEDVPVQLVDTPPITAEHIPAGMAGALDHADAVLIVLDASAESVLENMETCLSVLAARKLHPTHDPQPSTQDDLEGMPVRCLVACNKCDLPGAMDTLETLRDLYPPRIKFLSVSAETGENLGEMMKLLFDLLHVVRVYAKPPGKPPDMNKPFILHIGSTVRDLADHIHHELGANVHGARVWGRSVHDGQQVHADYVLVDRDIVQLSV